MDEEKIDVNVGFFDYQYISSNIGDDVQTFIPFLSELLIKFFKK
jgi:hypothetical protein